MKYYNRLRPHLGQFIRFYIFISAMFGFLLGVIITILIISTEHKLF